MSQSKLYLTRKDDGLPLSRDEYADADFGEPGKYERVAGRLRTMSPAGEEHVDSADPFLEALMLYRVRHRELVHRVVPEAWIGIGDDIDRIADIAVYLAGGKGRIPERVPDLVFEIVSPGSEHRDYQEKRAEYESLGVREYVIVDRARHQVTVLRLERGSYVEAVLGPDDVYTTTLLPGLEIGLAGVV